MQIPNKILFIPPIYKISTNQKKADTESKLIKWVDVKNSLEAWLFLLKHANEGKELPTFGNPTIKDALDRIRVNNATEDMFMSQLSEKKRQDEYNTHLASAVLKAEAAAKEAAKEAAKKATKNKTLEIAMTMLKRKYGINEIISICSLSSKEVLKLKASLEKG